MPKHKNLLVHSMHHIISIHKLSADTRTFRYAWAPDPPSPCKLHSTGPGYTRFATIVNAFAACLPAVCTVPVGFKGLWLLFADSCECCTSESPMPANMHSQKNSVYISKPVHPETKTPAIENIRHHK